MPEHPTVEVTVNVEAGGAGVDEEILKAAVVHTLSGHRVGGALSLTLIDDPAIRALHGAYLGKDRVTDVIAFSLGEVGALLGDVYVGVEQARRQAEEHDVDVREELVRLAVHGTLHVLGHEHPEGEDRFGSPMFELQERLVREILAD
jgi:probable rRNA maturation factor